MLVETCKRCKGKGIQTCMICGGNSYNRKGFSLPRSKPIDIYSRMRESDDEVCPGCQGSGKIECLLCNGKGYID